MNHQIVRNMWKIIMYIQYYSNLIGKSDVSAFCLGKNLGVQPRYQTQFFRRDFSHLQFLQVKGKNNFSRFGLTVVFSHDSFGTLRSAIHCKLTRQSDKTYKLINVINK